MPSVLLRFTVIRERAAEIIGIQPEQVTQQHLADLFGVNVSTISRLMNGRYKPGLDTALDMARVLGLAVEKFAVRVTAGE